MWSQPSKSSWRIDKLMVSVQKVGEDASFILQMSRETRSERGDFASGPELKLKMQRMALFDIQ